MYKRLNFIIEAQGLTYDTARHQNVHQVSVDVHSVLLVGVARFFYKVGSCARREQNARDSGERKYHLINFILE